MIRNIEIHIRKFVGLASFLLLMTIFLTSCFTGIESTKKITLSKDDRRQTAPTPEETYLNDVVGSPNSAWPIGKEFFVADERASVMIDPIRILSGDDRLHRGDILTFQEARSLRTPDGATRTTILFRRGDDEFRYMAREAADDRSIVMSDAIPGLIDPEMIRAVESRLKGKKLWTLSTLWLDSRGERMEGKKFDPVTVTEVAPGTMVFPVSVSFRDSEGKEGEYLMNFGSSGIDSRSFANLFSLKDPREDHPGITDEVWSLIQRAAVAPGMTKEECRLAKGNPSDVYDGHDYSKSMLLWVYPDATTLYFEDDILTNVKGY